LSRLRVHCTCHACDNIAHLTHARFVARIINESPNAGVSTAGEVFSDRQGGFVIELVLIAPLNAIDLPGVRNGPQRAARESTFKEVLGFLIAWCRRTAACREKGRKYSYEGEDRFACAVSAESLSLGLHIEVKSQK